MRRDLEALLFATDQPLTLAKLAGFFPSVDRKAIREALKDLAEEYDRDQHAFTIVEFGGGYSISTRPEHAKLVRKLFRGRRKVRLSKPALECMSIIAYKQPVTRLEVEEIRGVSVQGVLGTLLERDLISIVGRAESLGHPLLYGTTKTFLDYLGLRHLRELPQLSELEDILAQKEELKQLAARYGDELGELQDEDLDQVLGGGDEGDEAAEASDAEGEEPADRTPEDASPETDAPANDAPDAEATAGDAPAASEATDEEDAADDDRATADDGATDDAQAEDDALLGAAADDSETPPEDDDAPRLEAAAEEGAPPR